MTQGQAEAFDLPSAPPKASDRRKFEGRTVQCEALAPDVLAGILHEAITARRDAEIETVVLQSEQETRQELLAMLGVEL